MAEQIAAISSAVLDNMRVGSRPTDCLRIVSNPSCPWFLFDEEKTMLEAEKEQDDEAAQAILEKYLKFANSCYETTRRRLAHLLVCWEKLMLEKDTFDKNNKRLGEPLVTGLTAREFVTLYSIISWRAIVGCPEIPDDNVRHNIATGPAETSGQGSVKRERLDDPGEEASKKVKVDV
ncbi:hypothetical protein PG993_006140 [Apiospora rasikravindrae]|uniref:Uncharacterized protein n=1 Tax=Apiospora rasikravindrae TaxID=990691 RepID=A0ABR1TAS0_9PEZI